MTLPFNTRQAAKEIGSGATAAKLFGLIYRDKIQAPPKNASGDYLWTDEFLELARAALAKDLRTKAHRTAQVKVPA
jgi:hypothetical protein